MTDQTRKTSLTSHVNLGISMSSLGSRVGQRRLAGLAPSNSRQPQLRLSTITAVTKERPFLSFPLTSLSLSRFPTLLRLFHPTPPPPPASLSHGQISQSLAAYTDLLNFQL